MSVPSRSGRSIPRASRTRRLGRTGAGLAALAALAVLFVLAPSAGAATTYGIVHVTILTAPYAHVTVATASAISTNSCGAAVLTTQPFFDSASGVGGMAAKATEHSCPSPFAGYVYSEGSVLASMKLPTMAGQSKVIVKWSVAMTGSTSLAAGTCRNALANQSAYYSCDVYGFAEVSGYAYVEDLTNGSATYGSGSFYLYNFTESLVYCYQGNCSTTVQGSPGPFATGGSFVTHLNTTGFVAGHRYALVLSVSGYSSAEVLSYDAVISHAHVATVLNLATLGSGVTLAQVVIR